MTDRMMLACMFAAAVAVMTLVVILCMIISKRQPRKKKTPEQQPTIPAEIYGQNTYETRYIYTPRDTFTSNRKIRIRPEYYERLRQVAIIPGFRFFSMIAYVDNILRVHFEENGEYIEQFCRKNEPQNTEK